MHVLWKTLHIFFLFLLLLVFMFAPQSFAVGQAPSTDDLREQIADLLERIQVLQEQLQSVKAAPARQDIVFAADLYRGVSGNDVWRLQNFLAKDVELYPEGLITAYFGSLTERAVQRFQAKYGIVSSGSPATTGYGRVGPRTRAKLNEFIAVSLEGEAAVLKELISEESVSVPEEPIVAEEPTPPMPDPGTVKWSRNISSDDLPFRSSPAIAPDGTVYAASGKDWKLYALNPEDGLTKWTAALGNTGRLYSSPAVADDGTIYIGAGDKYLYAISSSGTRKWRFATLGVIEHSSPAIAPDGTVYIGAEDNRIRAFNPDGTEQWSFNTTNKIRSAPAIGSDGTVYATSFSKQLYALDPVKGGRVWSFGAADVLIESSPAIGADGTIYYGSHNSRFYAVTPTGEYKWEFDTDGAVGASVAIATDGTLYIPSNDRKLYALNPNGTKKWVFDPGYSGASDVGSPTLGADGTIYVGLGGNELFAVSSTGKELWRFTTDAGVYSSPAISFDGTLYFGAGDTFYAVHTASPGLMDSIWPKFHRDNKNTGRVADVVAIRVYPQQGMASTLDALVNLLYRIRNSLQ